jgi:hypothetical protein
MFLKPDLWKPLCTQSNLVENKSIAEVRNATKKEKKEKKF